MNRENLPDITQEEFERAFNEASPDVQEFIGQYMTKPIALPSDIQTGKCSDAAEFLFQTMWRKKLVDSGDTPDLEKLKTELFNYYWTMRNMAMIYQALTGGEPTDPGSLGKDIADIISQRFDNENS